jgi:predicted ATPase/DNA-binding winged helix-turn-helix (wHTH) protein
VLSHSGAATTLGARAVAVLTALVEHRNEYIPKARIIDAAWPDLVVEESNLAVQISAIRRVLAQTPGGERWIQTLSRRGYRFVGPVTELAESSIEPGGKRANLPEVPTSFFGRERELDEIKHLLSTTRLLTLVGTGGIGKTRLALQVAAGISGGYSDGMWFVDLAPLSDSKLVASAVTQALRLHESPGKPLIETLCSQIKTRELLLILDNCEHLLDACVNLTEALLRTTRATIIATSREPLQVAGEQIYAVQALSLPEPLASIECIGRSDAVQLFVERAQRQQGGFSLTPSRAPVIAQLCTHLDGIPLALELAAARIRSLSVEQINARIGDRFRLLTGGSRTALPRQQTLRATLDWSFDLLAAEERVVLRRLAIFAGGFTLEAASAVASDEAIDEHAVIDLLSRLVSRSLVIADTTSAGARYRLLETTRAYAMEKLTKSDETAVVRRRHACYFRDRFMRATDDWLRMSDTVWHTTYPPELDNVRAALEWASGEGGDPVLGVSLAGSSRALWTQLALFDEGMRRVQAAIGQIGPQTPVAEQARLWFALASLWSTAAPAQAAEGFERASELYRRVDDSLQLGVSLLELGRIQIFMGRLEQAADVLIEALRLLEIAGVPRELARCLEGFGFIRVFKGDLVGARAHFEKALSLYRGIEAEAAALGLLLNLADVTWALGDLDAALAGFQRALTLMRESAHFTKKDMLGHCLTNLAGVHTERGDLDQALAAAREGLRLRKGYPWGAMDHLALRAVLAGKILDGARIAGYADFVWATKQSPRQVNEARARERVQNLLRERLSHAELDRLLAEGAKMSENEACLLALEEH